MIDADAFWFFKVLFFLVIYGCIYQLKLTATLEEVLAKLVILQWVFQLGAPKGSKEETKFWVKLTSNNN